MSVLDIYQATLDITRDMRTAARAQDWDALAKAGQQRDRILETLPETLPALTTDDKHRLARLIEEILASHAEIADQAEPWLAHTAKLLAAFDKSGGEAANRALHSERPEST